ncbi:sugar ABC transporter substrate-binding protein [Mycetocola sp. JXN-3]|uniref:ABC transporter substrate-binding protein n=1 Tax=Mycetocola sp. JXN-3 TaxID=2116510 RepID=UPI00165CF3EE|nr:sugar ABC transporter substrate-binding protein [Mycetocola sp. JXN-3]
MRRVSLALVALSATAALALSGCSASSGDSGSADGSVVKLLGAEDPATFAPVISAFEAENKGTTVKYTQVPFDQLSSTLQQRLAAKDKDIDVYTVDQPNVSQLAAQGFLEDLSDLKDQAKKATTPEQYSVNVYQDKLWALSVWNSTQMMFVNNDALAKAGIAAPSANPAERWTWEQTVDAGKAAQAAGSKWGLLFEQVEGYYQLQPLAESLGGGSGITGKDMLTADVTNPGWTKAMQWYADLYSNNVSPRGVGGFQTSPVFADGDVPFFIGGPWDVGKFAENAKFNWSVVPMPAFAGGKAVTPNGSWSWGINPASDHKDAAKKFLEFAALNPAGNLATTEKTTIIPANTEAQAKYLPTLEAFGGTHSAGVADLITEEIKNTAVPRPVSVGYVQFESMMNKAFADIRNGSPVEARLKDAQSQIEAAWKKLR